MNAPASGGDVGAKAASLTIMAGGPEVHGQRMVERDFAPGFRIELHQKDLNLALQGAKLLGVSLPSTAACQELFNACAAHGGSAWDHSAMIRALEIMANHEIASQGDLQDKAA